MYVLKAKEERLGYAVPLTVIITIVSVVLTLLICYFVAYGLTMYNYRLKTVSYTHLPVIK